MKQNDHERVLVEFQTKPIRCLSSHHWSCNCCDWCIFSIWIQYSSG